METIRESPLPGKGGCHRQMRRLIIFSALALVLAMVDLYLINISPYIASGLAVGYMADRK